MEFIKNIYLLFNKIIIYSFSKLNIFEKQHSISNNKIIKKNMKYENKEEMYGQFIYFD
jgi:hypothetical protein